VIVLCECVVWLRCDDVLWYLTSGHCDCTCNGGRCCDYHAVMSVMWWWLLWPDHRAVNSVVMIVMTTVLWTIATLMASSHSGLCFDHCAVWRLCFEHTTVISVHARAHLATARGGLGSDSSRTRLPRGVKPRWRQTVPPWTNDRRFLPGPTRSALDRRRPVAAVGARSTVRAFSARAWYLSFADRWSWLIPGHRTQGSSADPSSSLLCCSSFFGSENKRYEF
jgi:hypothetical protein